MPFFVCLIKNTIKASISSFCNKLVLNGKPVTKKLLVTINYFATRRFLSSFKFSEFN